MVILNAVAAVIWSANLMICLYYYEPPRHCNGRYTSVIISCSCTFGPTLT